MDFSIDWNEKSLSARPDKVSNMDLTTKPKCLILVLAPGNITYLCLYVIIRTKHHQKKAGI